MVCLAAVVCEAGLARKWNSGSFTLAVITRSFSTASSVFKALCKYELINHADERLIGHRFEKKAFGSVQKKKKVMKSY